MSRLAATTAIKVDLRNIKVLRFPGEMSPSMRRIKGPARRTLGRQAHFDLLEQRLAVAMVHADAYLVPDRAAAARRSASRPSRHCSRVLTRA
jgi:hypothetical protein